MPQAPFFLVILVANEHSTLGHDTLYIYPKFLYAAMYNQLLLDYLTQLLFEAHQR